MKDYIISPSFIYWINALDSFGFVVVAILIVGIMALIIMLLAMSVEFEWDVEYDDDAKRLMKCIKATTIIVIISMLLVTFVPSKDTLIKMQLCKYGTKANAEKVLDVLNDKTDKIIEAISNSKSED